MAAGPAYIGITENATDTYIQSVEIEKKVGIDVVRKSATGGFLVAHAADPISEGTIVVVGTTAEEPGAALATELTSISGGKTFVSSVATKLVNDNFNESTIKFEHAPSATIGP